MHGKAAAVRSVRVPVASAAGRGYCCVVHRSLTGSFDGRTPLAAAAAVDEEADVVAAMLPVCVACRRRGVVDIITVVTCIAGVLLTTCVLCVRGEIYWPHVANRHRIMFSADCEVSLVSP